MKRLFFYIVFLSFIACSKEKDNPKDNNSCISNQNAQTISHDGLTREYIVYVPRSYDGNTAVPLVFNFHGFGGLASEYMSYANMRPQADAQNFILIYPQGSCLNGDSHWNASLPGPDNKSNADDFGFIEALITKLNSSYNIDNERIYACGYSNGGMLAYALACYKNNLIAGACSVSGCMLDNDCSPTNPTAILSIHGTSDDVLSYNGNSSFNSVAFALNYWTTFNNTDGSPSIDSYNDNGTTIEHHVYANGDSSVTVEHYKVIGGGHDWFNMSYQGNNTGDLIWNHLSQYNIYGKR
ncbi:MAG: PHB depolymerase family esterase [Vicingaceae bacterium]|nr:PHB depolymerase family esterase [Vicingaceae bacterium]